MLSRRQQPFQSLLVLAFGLSEAHRLAGGVELDSVILDAEALASLSN